MLRLPVIIIIFFSLLCCTCRDTPETLFSKLSKDRTGIDFRNLLVEDDELNVAHYLYFYNGAGVAIGDINNDGLQDIFFTGNMVKNRLYLNEGDFNFTNITDKSGVAEKQGWCTGANMIDINQDGYLDIYVCRSADDDPQRRKNLLFINNRDLTFTEEAEKYGLADQGYSTQSAFFDYDKDGDLDCFVLNHSISKYSVGVADNPELRKIKNPDYQSRLYRNDNNHFSDVSEQAGIISNVLSFGLGVALSDFNNDGWTDIYVSNDFKEQDYLFMNNGNGKFTESFEQCMDIASLNSMGSDAADFNNDGLTDIITLDMLAEGNYLQKTHAGPHNFDKTTFLISKGFQPQYMRNMLHKNNGDGTFSEIGQFAGVSNTDWSWAALLSDFDNDGRKDLFISNGFVKDFSDLDFISYSSHKLTKQEGISRTSFEEQVAQMPTIKIPNYIYRNTGEGSFENKTTEWGLDEPLISCGAAYADLDNDGDMDLVVSNTNDRASVLRNNSSDDKRFIRIMLEGSGKNWQGIGAKVKLYCGGNTYYQEQFPVRGYQSSVDMILNFGLGTHEVIDSLLVIWPDDRYAMHYSVKANQLLTLKAADATQRFTYMKPDPETLFSETRIGKIEHAENNFNDFTVQTSLLHYLSRQGPCIATGDVNGDGLQDLFTGGAKGRAGTIMLQQPDGKFSTMRQPALEKDSAFEDVDATLFDANVDGHADLYVASGGYEFIGQDSLLEDRLYINDGKGKLNRKPGSLPQQYFSGSCVRPSDVDGDGDTDLFVGQRVIPGRYPLAPASTLLVNDGSGNFTNAAHLAPGLAKLGMVTDALWLDVNRDGTQDLLVVGEWMPIKLFINNKGKLEDASSRYITTGSNGWWNTISSADFDHDGDEDVIVGNAGTNLQFRASSSEPVTLYHKDFDGNGSIDPVFCYYIQGKSYPAASRDDLLEQLPALKKKFNDYNSYAKATLSDIFTAEELKDAGVLKAELLSTVYLQNNGDAPFTITALPAEAQYAPVHAIAVLDANADGHNDVVLGGNTKWTRVQFGRHLANHGTVFLGNGKGDFTYVPQFKSGLNIRGEVRKLKLINTRRGQVLLAGINDAPAQAYTISKNR